MRTSSHPIFGRSFRRALWLLLVTSLLVAAISAGCGTPPDGFAGFSDLPDSGVPSPDDPGGPNGCLGCNAGDAAADALDPDALGTLIVTPPTASIQVTVVDGVVTVNAPVQFSASYNGKSVPATWLFDRAELADVDSNGKLTASGKTVGDGTLTARYGAREGTAKITVTMVQSQNGGTSSQTGGFGGLGGVGGEPLGPAVSATIANKLKTQSNAPATVADLGFLYPYDKTVWPRGLLPPLLMWQSTHEADAIWVKLSQGNFAYEGTFSVSTQPAGSDARKRVRIDDAPWNAATSGNQGDPLKVEVKIYSAAEDKVIGPISETWTVASGVLKGTVYYNSYDSHIVNPGGATSTGGVIAIKPRSPDPALAVPALAGKCHVCHTVSADGSTMFEEESLNGTDDGHYEPGASYDLTKATPPRTSYSANEPRKFVWAAPYPDGSFALTGARFAREAQLAQDSNLLFRNGLPVSLFGVAGLSGVVTSAVTPAFSPDGRKVAFNFWEGAGAGGVSPGAGTSLAVMDFSCGAAAGAVKCGNGAAYTFSKLREIYRDAAKYPAWPSFTPDGKAVVFHNTVSRGTCGPNPPDRTSEYNCQISTWFSAQAELWLAPDGAGTAKRLSAANGTSVAMPTNGDHPNDSLLNYQPTVNPVASGGYYWVVFTSRRIYGNLLGGKPWGTDGLGGGPQKKLWVAAIDINTGAVDPSHPAFYLPGQELGAGNSRGFWVVDPCKQNGNSCESGDECCNGFCRKDSSGALVCMDQAPGTPCAQEFEKCTVDADCCDPKQKCLGGRCSQGDPVVK